MTKLLILIIFLLGIGASCQSEVVDEYNWSEMNEGPYQDNVSYATSTDLLHWTDSEVILAEHASVPGALYKDGVIYVYFTDVSKNGQPEQIGFIQSEDQGQTWSAKQILEIEGKDKNIVPVDLTPLATEEGKIRLYYFDIANKGSASHEIYSAISEDGINFRQEEGARFIYDDIYDPEVIKVGSTYYLYVGADNKVLAATSADGLNFEFQGIAYEGGAIPDVIYENNQFYLYTGGIDISFSTDGLNYEKTNYFFRSGAGEVTADAGVVKLGDNSYFMVYKHNKKPIKRKMN